MKNTDIHRLLSRYYETWAGINAAYDRIAARCGVTSNVLYLLDTLYCAEAPMTQSEIGARLGLPKQTVASMVSTLERRGYVVREVAKDDHRRRHVLLTDEGRAYAKPRSETAPSSRPLSSGWSRTSGSPSWKQAKNCRKR